MTKAFLYSLFLHSTIVVLVIALFLVYKSDDERVLEKRCKIMLSQVCERAPAQTKPNSPAIQKQKKPLEKVQPEKKETVKEPIKRVPAPVAEEKPAVEKKTEQTEVKEDEPVEAQQESEVVEADEQIDEALTATSNAPVALSQAAQKATEEKPTDNVTPEETYINENIAAIMALLKKNLYYPRMARKRCIEGEVHVRFELLENGDIENITVIDAVNDILARAAVTTIERLEGKFPLPKERLVLNVPIMYVLN
ncbi:TonB family protein [bacterium]|nr:TonB family protein [bacterium]